MYNIHLIDFNSFVGVTDDILQEDSSRIQNGVSIYSLNQANVT